MCPEDVGGLDALAALNELGRDPDLEPETPETQGTPLVAEDLPPAPQPGIPLQINVTPDGLLALVPQGSAVDPAVLNWSYPELHSYLIFRGFLAQPLREDFDTFFNTLRASPESLSTDLVLVRGRPPRARQSNRFKWLNRKPVPIDHAIQGRAFIQVVPAKDPMPGVNVRGIEIPVPPAADKPDLTWSDDFQLTEDGNLVPNSSGQASMQGRNLILAPSYQVEDPSVPQLQKAEFYCTVDVLGDLAGTPSWKIKGELRIAGHWSAPDVEVHGNVTVEHGIQTNMEGVIRIFGNCRTQYIQQTRMGIAGDLFVETGIVQSEVRVGGSIFCRGSPGAIMGSNVACFGDLHANRVGADEGRRTKIMVRRGPWRTAASKVNIANVNRGTGMEVFGKVWNQMEDGPFAVTGE